MSLEKVATALEIVKTSPTILDPEVEMDVAKIVMGLSAAELAEARAEVRIIMGEMVCSHVDNDYMLMDTTNQYTAFFAQFGTWIESANTTHNLGIDSDTLGLFAQTKADIEHYYLPPS